MLSLVMLLGISCSKKEPVEPEIVLSTDEQKLLVALDSFRNIYYRPGYEAEIDAIADNIQGNTADFIQDINNLIASDENGLLLLVDKKHYLANTFVPEDLVDLTKNPDYAINRTDLSLRVCVEEALRKMAVAAKTEGITLLVSSTFRTYDYQKRLYERNVREMGKEAADRESAMPGSSQHQTGTAIDFGSITDAFAEDEPGIWLAENANKYGFSLSYPQGYEPVTGYRWECWHYRYIGQSAVFMQEKWFNNVQQYMLDFIHFYKNADISQNVE
ncbi:MAG: M15 family metallopeptidase [Spirochaetaceae bacterium]|nr:M15 family metallopeptidase [Spirochaetaceae bacterium]